MEQMVQWVRCGREIPSELSLRIPKMFADQSVPAWPIDKRIDEFHSWSVESEQLVGSES